MQRRDVPVVGIERFEVEELGGIHAARQVGPAFEEPCEGELVSPAPVGRRQLASETQVLHSAREVVEQLRVRWSRAHEVPALIREISHPRALHRKSRGLQGEGEPVRSTEAVVQRGIARRLGQLCLEVGDDALERPFVRSRLLWENQWRCQHRNDKSQRSELPPVHGSASPSLSRDPRRVSF